MILGIILGMLIMYVIAGIIIFCSAEFGMGTDDWVQWVFLWYIALPINTISTLYRKNKKRVDKKRKQEYNNKCKVKEIRNKKEKR